MANRYRSATFIAGSILIACFVLGFPDPSIKASSSSREVALEQWARDLDFLSTELPKRHKNLFHNISESELQTQIEELKTKLPSLALDEILVGFMKITACVGDSHTTLGYRPQQGLPLMLYWFKDGIAILNTTSEYKTSCTERSRPLFLAKNNHVDLADVSVIKDLTTGVS